MDIETSAKIFSFAHKIFPLDENFLSDKNDKESFENYRGGALSRSITVEIRLAGKKAIVSLARRRQKLSVLRVSDSFGYFELSR